MSELDWDSTFSHSAVQLPPMTEPEPTLDLDTLEDVEADVFHGIVLSLASKAVPDDIVPLTVRRPNTFVIKVLFASPRSKTLIEPGFQLRGMVALPRLSVEQLNFWIPLQFVTRYNYHDEYEERRDQINHYRAMAGLPGFRPYMDCFGKEIPREEYERAKEDVAKERKCQATPDVI